MFCVFSKNFGFEGENLQIKKMLKILEICKNFNILKIGDSFVALLILRHVI